MKYSHNSWVDESFSKIIEKYNFDAVILTGFCLREAAEKTLNFLHQGFAGTGYSSYICLC